MDVPRHFGVLGVVKGEGKVGEVAVPDVLFVVHELDVQREVEGRALQIKIFLSITRQ